MRNLEFFTCIKRAVQGRGSVYLKESGQKKERGKERERVEREREESEWQSEALLGDSVATNKEHLNSSPGNF
jgi:hypothetical protein